MYFPKAGFSRRLVREWSKSYARHLASGRLKGLADQRTMHRLLRKQKSLAVRTALLPAKIYPNGRRYFRYGATKRALMVHNNCIKGLARKVARFKQNGMWIV